MQGLYKLENLCSKEFFSRMGTSGKSFRTPLSFCLSNAQNDYYGRLKQFKRNLRRKRLTRIPMKQCRQIMCLDDEPNPVQLAIDFQRNYDSQISLSNNCTTFVEGLAKYLIDYQSELQ
eukprot:TRINITY_DN74826_c0_g2_i1.p2 TRINITY_DN74826_c0_g2~~TRINITY_DN74826_c0_g2_i1.p2  ORF type:complete len:118 (-),score=1.81 TRINITY_DN74826_c0_g2_i1:273-626(-)